MLFCQQAGVKYHIKCTVHPHLNQMLWISINKAGKKEMNMKHWICKLRDAQK